MTGRAVTLEIGGMHCVSCGLLVDDCMEDVPGVRSSRTDVKSGRCTVTLDEDVADAHLLAAVLEAGYVGTVLAAP
jgi:copper chaperone CopZ